MNEVRAMTRKEYQQVLAKRNQRRQRRRKARLRRLRVKKSIQSLKFWARVCVMFVVFLCIAFWARFAFVYDIPSYAEPQLPDHIRAYVTVKPWWFGPPVFDISHYATASDLLGTIGDPYQYLVLNLGRYAGILNHTQFIWTLKS